MSNLARDAEDLAKQALPELRLGPEKTKTSALHPMYFVGTLEQWPDFEQQVWMVFNDHTWVRRILAHQARGKEPLSYLTQDMVAVGDEHGVQGRFNQHVGQVMSGILKSQGMDIIFVDFKCTTEDYAKISDVACLDNTGLLLAMGELKTWWVREHNLSAALWNESNLRTLLAQPALYMQELKIQYGFISTYKETLFLRQVFSNGGWRLQYSPIIKNETVGHAAAPQGWMNSGSLRQCMFYLSQEAIADHRAVNNSAAWVNFF